MPRDVARDSVFAGTLNASVSIGGSSCVLASTTGIDWGTTSTYAVQVGDDPLDDAELVHVTRSGATLTLASPSTTFTKAHSAGANVYLIVSAVDLNNKGSKDATNTWDLSQTMSSPLLLANGTAAAPSETFASDTNTGSYRIASDQYGIATGGSERIRVNSAGLFVTGSVTPTGVLNNGLTQLIAGSQSLSLTTTAGELEVASASSIQLYLPSIVWSRTTTPVYIIKDPRSILTDLQIIPLVGTDFFAANDHNSINEGYGAEGAWADAVGGTGPAGAHVALSTPGCVWRLSVQRNDPGVAGGAGGWNLNKIASGGYT